MSVEGDALEEVTPELVRRIADALAEGRNDEARRLLEELSLVDEHAMHGRMFVMLGDSGEEIVAVAEHLSLRFETDARRDQPVVALAVVAGDEQHR